MQSCLHPPCSWSSLPSGHPNTESVRPQPWTCLHLVLYLGCRNVCLCLFHRHRTPSTRIFSFTSVLFHFVRHDWSLCHSRYQIETPVLCSISRSCLSSRLYQSLIANKLDGGSRLEAYPTHFTSIAETKTHPLGFSDHIVKFFGGRAGPNDGPGVAGAILPKIL